MKRLMVYCEGLTEESFVKTVLVKTTLFLLNGLKRLS